MFLKHVGLIYCLYTTIIRVWKIFIYFIVPFSTQYPRIFLGLKKQWRGICPSCIHYGTNRLIIKKWCNFFLWNFQELPLAFHYDIPIKHTIILRHTVIHNKRLSSQTGTRTCRALLKNNLVSTPVVYGMASSLGSRFPDFRRNIVLSSLITRVPSETASYPTKKGH